MSSEKRGPEKRGDAPMILVGKLALAAVAVGAAARGDFGWAAWALVFAAVMDLTDPPRHQPRLRSLGAAQRLRILCNALCFGITPAFIAHETFLRDEPWGWALATFYSIAAAVGISRSKIEPDRSSNPTTPGLPASAAGAVLVTIHPFFTASAVAPLLGGLPNAQGAGGLMICLLILMVGPIPYPVAPRLVFDRAHLRNWTLGAGAAGLAAVFPETVVFPMFAVYTFWGIAEGVTPVLAEGILEGAGDEAREGMPETAPDELPEPGRSYRARSTWE